MRSPGDAPIYLLTRYEAKMLPCTCRNYRINMSVPSTVTSDRNNEHSVVRVNDT
jgi:hypothetical protein